MKQGSLFIVSTPIGNLEDITLRALRILKDVELIAAEDTRRTRKLLTFYGITTPLTSLYEQNERQKSGLLISKLKDGLDIAYVSDAGTPGISDPGYLLIRQTLEQSIDVVPVPGPSAVLAALCVSGLPMDSFVFHAFLPSRSLKRRQFLASLSDETKTMVFYESPKRIVKTLQDIQQTFGNRNIVVSRELTKMHEEILRGPVKDIIAIMADRTIKGEITLIVAGADKTPVNASTEEIQSRFKEIQKNWDLSTRDTADLISGESGLPRNKVYKAILQLLEE